MTAARYGDGSLYSVPLYGAAVVTDRKLTWGLIFDWDGDGFFTGENELHGLYDVDIESGRQFQLEQVGGGFQPVDVGRATFSYKDPDNRYDPYNPDSPLYGNLLPGRLFSLMVRDEVSNIRYPIMKGRIKDIRPTYGEVNIVKISCENLVRELQKLTVHTPVYTSTRYDTAIATLLAAAGWKFGSTIDTTVSEAMAFWWASGRSLFDEIRSVSDAALAMWCIGEDGKLVYRSRISNESPSLTLTGLNVELAYGIRAPTPDEAIRNHVKVYSRPRVPVNNQVVWSMTEVPIIGAGKTLTIWANFSYLGQDGVVSYMAKPVPTTDYLANTAADGSGVDKTGKLVIQTFDFGTAAKLTIRNNDTAGVYLTKLQLRGDVIVPAQYTFVEDQDDASMANFGELLMEVKSDWLQDANTARDEALLLIDRLSQARRYPRVRILPNLALQFGLPLFGLAQIDIASKGISGEYRLGYIHHKWMDETGKNVLTEAFFEPNLLSNTAGTWIFPATFGLTTVF